MPVEFVPGKFVPGIEMTFDGIMAVEVLFDDLKK